MSRSVEKIISLIQSNDLYAALLLTESELEGKPNSSELLVLSIDLNRRLGKNTECKFRLNQLIAKIPKSSALYIELSKKLYSQKQFDTALDVLGFAKNLFQFNEYIDIFYYTLVAQNYYRLSDAPTCELKNPGEYAQKILQDYPSSLAGYAYTAKELAIVGKYDQSKQIIRDGLNLFKNNLNLLCIYSDIYRLSGNRKKSAKINKFIMDIYPRAWNGYYRFGQDLVILQQTNYALDVIKKGLSNVSNNYFLLSLAIDLARISNRLDEMNSFARVYVNCFSKNKSLSHQSYSKYIDTKIPIEYVKSKDNTIPNNAEGNSRLFILTGCSGSGKTSLLRSAQLDTKLLFSAHVNGKQICKISTEILEELKLVSQIEKKRNSVSESYERAMLFGSYFPLAQFYNLQNEPYLPKEVILHIDIRQLLFSRKIAHLYNIRHFDFNYQNLVRHGYWRIMEFFAHPVFRQFQDISISTIEPSYDRNLQRFQGRESIKFFLGHENPHKIYSEMYGQWFKFVSSIQTKSDNIIIEKKNGYSIYNRSDYNSEF